MKKEVHKWDELVQAEVLDIHTHHAFQPETVVLKEGRQNTCSADCLPESALAASRVVQAFALVDQGQH